MVLGLVGVVLGLIAIFIGLGAVIPSVGWRLAIYAFVFLVVAAIGAFLASRPRKDEGVKRGVVVPDVHEERRELPRHTAPLHPVEGIGE